jgi:hypothetical protein
MMTNRDDTRSERSTQHLFLALVAAAVAVFALRALVLALLPGAPAAAPVVPEQRQSADEARAEQAAAEEQAARLRAERMARQQQQEAEEKARREEKARLALQAHDASAAEAREEQQRREQAWNRYYRTPKKCLNPADDAAIVECSNHYLRAQQRFDKLYDAGKL